MLRVLNVILVVGVVASAFVMYSLEHAARKNERLIALLEREIGNERENIKLLNAEWSFLTKPARLERLAREHLKLDLIAPQQRVGVNELLALLPERPGPLAPQPDQDPIGDMLKGME